MDENSNKFIPKGQVAPNDPARNSKESRWGAAF